MREYSKRMKRQLHDYAARAYEAESRARRRTTTFVESIADGLVVFDAQSRFTHVNSRAAEMWRRSPSELSVEYLM